MRFAGCLFVGVGILVVACLALVSLERRSQEYERLGDHARHGTAETAPPDEAGLRRLEAKKTITRRLIDGQLTLLEAAAWFRYLNEATPDGGDDSWPPDRALPKDEQYCRQVIRWAGGTLEQTSRSQAGAFVRRLEAELDAYKHGDGLNLPPAGGDGVD